MEKYYQLATHTEAEWDELNAELISTGHVSQSVPSRGIECVDDQLHSLTRGTYLLTDAEADTAQTQTPCQVFVRRKSSGYSRRASKRNLSICSLTRSQKLGVV